MMIVSTHLRKMYPNKRRRRCIGQGSGATIQDCAASCSPIHKYLAIISSPSSARRRRLFIIFASSSAPHGGGTILASISLTLYTGFQSESAKLSCSTWARSSRSSASSLSLFAVCLAIWRRKPTTLSQVPHAVKLSQSFLSCSRVKPSTSVVYIATCMPSAYAVRMSWISNSIVCCWALARACPRQLLPSMYLRHRRPNLRIRLDYALHRAVET